MWLVDLRTVTSLSAPQMNTKTKRRNENERNMALMRLLLLLEEVCVVGALCCVNCQQGCVKHEQCCHNFLRKEGQEMRRMKQK